MKQVVLHIFLVFLCIHTISCELKFLIEIFRHGAKQSRDYNFWNSNDFPEPGEFFFHSISFALRLSPVGMRQHYILGSQIRNDYIINQNFVSEYYDDQHFNVRSTGQSLYYNRTLQSAISQLYGLYPLGTGPLLPKGINHSLTNPPYVNCSQIDPQFLASDAALPQYFQPICVHTVFKEHDTLLLPYEACPGAATVQEQLKNTSVYQQIFQMVLPYCKSVAKKINYTGTILTFYDCAKFMDEFEAAKYANWEQPQLNDTEWKIMNFVQNIDLYIELFQTQQSISFFSTPMIETIINLFNNSVTGANKKLRWQIYSAHNPTIGFMLAALNLTSYQCIYELFAYNKTSALNCIDKFPEFASNIFIELYLNETTNNTYYVKVRYNGNYYYLCSAQSYECEYTQFISRIQSQILPNWTQACGVNFEMAETGIHHREVKTSFYEVLDNLATQQKEEEKIKKEIINENPSYSPLISEEIQMKVQQTEPEKQAIEPQQNPSTNGILNFIIFGQSFIILVFAVLYFSPFIKSKIQHITAGIGESIQN